MAYAEINFKTKSALKKAVAEGRKIAVYNPGPFPVAQNGRVTVEGPHYPQPHRWWASATVENGVIVRVS